MIPIRIDKKNKHDVIRIANKLLLSSGIQISELVSEDIKMVSTGKKLKSIPEKAAQRGRVSVIKNTLIETNLFSVIFCEERLNILSVSVKTPEII